jgi:PAS domain S-box-containing protein
MNTRVDIERRKANDSLSMTTSVYSQNTFRNGGEMGALMLAHDWSNSPLGQPSQWPSSLRSVVSLMLGSDFPMFLIWGEERGLLYNDAYSVLLGKKHPAALGAGFEQVWSEIWSDLAPLVDDAFNGQATYHENWPLLMRRNGYDEQTWFTFSYSPVRDEYGHVVGMFCAATETTQHVLAQRRADFRLTLNVHMRDAVTSREAIDTGCILLGQKMNAAFCAFGEIEDDSFSQVQSAWVKPGLNQVTGRHALSAYGSDRIVDLLSGKPVLIEDVRTDPRTAGTIAEKSYADLGCRATLDVPLVRDGKVSALLGIGMAEPHFWTEDDVTLALETVEIMWQSAERARAEAKLAESEERFRAMADNAPVIVWVTDADGYCNYLNRTWYNTTGQSPEEALGFGWLEATHPDDKQMANDIFLEANAAHKPFRIEYRLRHADGSYRWAIDAAAPRFDEAGQFMGYIGSVIDIDERRSAEQRLIESELRYRTLFDSIDEGFCIVQFVDGPHGELSDFVHIEANAAYAENAGIPDIVGQYVRAVVGDEAEEWIRIYRDVLLTGEHIRFERVLEATGRHLELSAFRVEPADKRQVAVLFKDITPRKIAERELVALNDQLTERVEKAVAERATALAQLHEAQKLETLGQLTGGVAHDFNNLLTPIMGALDILSRRPELDDRTKRLIDGGSQAAEKARTLVQRLLAFSRRQTLVNEPVDICKVVGGMSDLIARSIGPQIKLTIGCPDVPQIAFVDPNQLELALLNLAVNARDAMPGGGKLDIDVHSMTAAEKAGLANGEYVCVRVIDNGAGMNDETLRRAIEPFFTTKDIGQGTGLGLSSVHGLAAQSNGLFELESELGHGTTATLWLPVSIDGLAAPEAKTTPAKQHMDVPAGRTVLLVDDEVLVRMGTAHMLQDIGYNVIEASSARQAIQLLANDDHIDALITDYAMPDMSGAELAERAAAMRPGLKMLLVTGYASFDQQPVIDLPRLEKPFGQDELAAAVSALLVTN